MSRRIVVLSLLAWFSLALWTAPFAAAQQGPVGKEPGVTATPDSLPIWTRPDSASLVKLGEKVRRMQHSVLIVGSPQVGHGTAFVISQQHRLLATNAHVADIMQRGKRMKAVSSETNNEYTIDFAWYHPGTVRYAGGSRDLLTRTLDPTVGSIHPLCADVAVLHVADDGTALPEALPIAPPEALRELFAQPIGMIGYPGHDSHFPRPGEIAQATYHQGVISRLTDFNTQPASDWRQQQFLQHTAPGWGGFSGSPLFLTSGEVIGLHNSGRFEQQGGRQAQLSHGVRIDCLWELLAYHHLDDKLPLPLKASELNLARFSQPDPAFERYRQVVALVTEAEALNQEQKFAESAAKCKQAMKLLPTYAPAYAARYRAFTNYMFKYLDRISSDVALEQVTLAMNDTKKYGELAPGDPAGPLLYAAALNNLAGIRTRRGRPQEENVATRRRVLEIVAQVLETPGLDDGLKVDAIATRATARAALQDSRGAEADYAEVIRLQPVEPLHYENRAYYYELQGRPNEAAADRRKAQQLRRLRQLTLTWQEFVSAEGRFQVEMPSQPKQQSRALGDFRYAAFVAESRELGFEFMIGYGDVPASLRGLSGIELLDRMRDRIAEGGKIEGEYDFWMADSPGREVQVRSGGRWSDSLVLRVGDRLYVSHVRGPADMLLVRTDVIRHMFASLKIEPPPGQKPTPPEPVDDGALVSRKGRFRVKFATEPKESTEQLGELLEHRLTAAHKSGAEFVVGYVDLPDELLKQHPSAADRVAIVREHLVGEGKLRSEREIKVSEQPATEMLIDRKDGAEMHARVVAVGRRVYHAAVSGPPLVLKDVAAASAEFFDSFAVMADASPPDAPAATIAWSDFRSKAGGFQARFPGQPKESTEQGAALLHHTFNVDVEQQEQTTTYSVFYADLAEAKEKQAKTPEEWLDAVRDRLAESGKLASEKKFRLAGQPGRDLVVEPTEGGRILARVLVVDQRLYELFVSGTSDEITFDDATVRQFINSFVLLPVPVDE